MLIEQVQKLLTSVIHPDFSSGFHSMERELVQQLAKYNITADLQRNNLLFMTPNYVWHYNIECGYYITNYDTLIEAREITIDGGGDICHHIKISRTFSDLLVTISVAAYAHMPTDVTQLLLDIGLMENKAISYSSLTSLCPLS